MIVEVKSKFIPENFERVLKDYSEFEWDDKKFDRNFDKHKISFDLASYIFESVRIERPDYGESHFDVRDEGERIYTIGKSKGIDGKTAYYTIIFIEVSDTRARIISARYADKDERRWYNEYC